MDNLATPPGTRGSGHHKEVAIMASTLTIHNTFCSGCGEDLRVDARTLTVRAGSKKVEAVDAGDLIEWECPDCGYADSLDPLYNERD